MRGGLSVGPHGTERRGLQTTRGERAMSKAKDVQIKVTPIGVVNATDGSITPATFLGQDETLTHLGGGMWQVNALSLMEVDAK